MIKQSKAEFLKQDGRMKEEFISVLIQFSCPPPQKVIKET